MTGGPEWLAVLAATSAVAPLVMTVVAGRLVDQLGERPSMVVGGLALVGSAVFAYLGSTFLWSLITATALLGIGVIFSVAAEQSAVAGRAHGQRMDGVFGVYTFTLSLGQALGPAMLLIPGEPGSDSPPIRLVALCCLLGAAVTLGVSFGFGSDHRGMRERLSNGGSWPARRLLAIPGLYRALLVSGLVLASIDLTVAYLPAVAHGRGIVPGWVTAMLTARSLMSMASRINLAFLSRTLGRTRLTVGACMVSAVSVAGLAAPVSAPVLVCLAATYGFAAGVCQPMTMAWVSQLSPPEARGRVMSLRLGANRLAQSVLPGVAVAAAAAGGAAGVLVLTGAALAVAAWSSSAIPKPET